MAKMREFLFWNESGQEEKTEQMSLTKAVKSIQTKFKDKVVGVEYISKKGQKLIERIELPWGRKKKLGK